ncbi:MAG TPA: TetR family transcriptional regulator [Acetobacteraceae bacterium]|nr:TetR family transcriptional regulator [Acetobacteraceae bacterium]
MQDSDFDRALIGAAFALAADRGWEAVSVAQAARRGGLPLDRARARFPGRAAILLRFGLLADQTALVGEPAEAGPRGQLFDLLMRRFDALQAHRAGVLALLRALPMHPATGLLLTAATLRSMRWMLEAASIGTHGPLGRLRVKGLLAVWLATVRAWQADDSADLSATMAALDRALARAERAAAWLPGDRPGPMPPVGEDGGEGAPEPPPPGGVPPAGPPPAGPGGGGVVEPLAPVPPAPPGGAGEGPTPLVPTPPVVMRQA